MDNKPIPLTPPSRTELTQWREFCEWLDSRPKKSAYLSTVGFKREWMNLLFSEKGQKKGIRREAIELLYRIELVFYSSGWGWRLRKNWQENLDFLEQECKNP